MMYSRTVASSQPRIGDEVLLQHWATLLHLLSFCLAESWQTCPSLFLGSPTVSDFLLVLRKAHDATLAFPLQVRKHVPGRGRHPQSREGIWHLLQLMPEQMAASFRGEHQPMESRMRNWKAVIVAASLGIIGGVGASMVGAGEVVARPCCSVCDENEVDCCGTGDAVCSAACKSLIYRCRFNCYLSC